MQDPQGRVIPSASVAVRCGSESRRVTASDVGEFLVEGMPPAGCSVTAESNAFEPETVTTAPDAPMPLRMTLQVRRLVAEVVVTPAPGLEREAFDTPDALSVVSRRDIDSRPYTQVPQVLQEEPGILLQQTTSAQASPIIRGFTGQSNLYLIDGVRLNNSSWRSGPSQYVSWVHGSAIEAIETVRGGGSVQYGSDALGGTIQLLTEPVSFARRFAPASGSFELSGASASGSVAGEGDVSIERRGFGLRIGGSWRRVNDLRAGGGLDSHAAVTRFLGLPSTVVASRLRDTGYDQAGSYAQAQVTSGRGLVRLLYMRDAQTGASRYDRVLGGAGVHRSGFDPQRLDFGFLRYTRSDVAGFDGLSATFSVNLQADGRYEQARPGARLDQQWAHTRSLGYQVQVHRNVAPGQQLLAGGELYDESIDASRRLFEPNGSVVTARPDVPAGISYRSAGAFVQHEADVVPDRITVRAGFRYARYTFTATADPALGVVDDRVTSNAVTFQGAGVIRLSDGLNLTVSVVRSFRAPNAADLGSIGLTGGGGFEIAPSRAAALGGLVGSSGSASAVSTGVPIPDGLRPEVAYQYDVGLKARRGRVSGAVNTFVMDLYDFIERRAVIFETPIVGSAISGFEVVQQDASGVAYIAQDPRPIATRVNTARGRIVGFETQGEVRLSSAWSARAHVSMVNGKALPSGEYLRRMPPPMGAARLRWNGGRLWTEGVVSFAARQRRLNSGDLGDARIGAERTASTIASFFNGTATDMGLVQNGVLVATGETLPEVQARVLGGASSAPLFTSQAGFVVVGVRGGVRLTPRIDLSIIGENLGDVNYRLYGSGLDAPGAGVHVRARFRF